MLDIALPVSLSSSSTVRGGAIRNRLSSPAPSRSLGATVTQAERPIREAIRILSRTVEVDDEAFARVFDCTVYGPGGVQESKKIRLTWFLVNVALTHAFATHRENVGPFWLALEWFVGEVWLAHRLLACFPEHQIKAAEIELSKLKASVDLLDLFPYVIEPHGHITRSNLEACKTARKTRNTKKNDGVYYTPSDVADFMVDTIASNSRPKSTWIDPACGTGVFLRSVLAWHQDFGTEDVRCDIRKFVLSCVFGIDKSALATDLTAFVLMIDCNLAEPNKDTAFSLWKLIKKNIVCMDALRLVSRQTTVDIHFAKNQITVIDEIFPTVGHTGFDHVVMNPPYATTLIDKNLRLIWKSLSDVPVGKHGDTHLPFSEMLWQFTSDNSSSAAILPLSVGTNTTKSYARLRNELIGSLGTKEFLFFDREPQALFGEDIKTRNLILFRQVESHESVVRTSRLLKWTAEKRPSIFNRSRLVTIEASQCGAFVPKLGSDLERIAYKSLVTVKELKYAMPITVRSNRVLLKDVVAGDADVYKHTLLVGNTAYNFINCFFSDGLPKITSRPYSSSPINAIHFNSKADTYAAFALISSRLCFWLWHVEGDGFHLTNDFLKRLPLWSIFSSNAAKASLSKYGKLLWEATQKTAVGAVNAGKQTYSFHCGHNHPMAIEIERILVENLHLNEDVSHWLKEFIQETVSIDGKHRMRKNNLELEKIL